MCQEEGLILNGKKLELHKAQVTFFFALFTKEGMRPDPKKLKRHRRPYTSSRQATAAVLSWHDNLHGGIHSPSKPSYTAAESLVERDAMYYGMR